MQVRGQLVLMVLLGLGSAMGGAMIGRTMVAPPRAIEVELHEWMHDQLHLDLEQTRKLDVIEQAYKGHAQALDEEAAGEKRALVAAVLADHGYGPQVEAAIAAQHRTGAEMQRAPLQVVAAMRGLLHPNQVAAFDAALATALSGQH